MPTHPEHADEASTVLRWSGAAVAVGGLAWLLKALVIALRDGSFEPVESVVFVGGLAAQIVGGIGLAALVARRGSTDVARIGVFAAALAAVSIGSMLLETGAQGAVDTAYAGGNQGLNEEAGVFATGAFWFVAGAALLGAESGTRGDPAASPRTAGPQPTDGAG